MAIAPNDKSPTREEDTKILAEGLVEKFGTDAITIVGRQIDLSIGDIQISWENIAMAIIDRND